MTLTVIPESAQTIQDTDLNNVLSTMLGGSVKYGLTPSIGTGLAVNIATGKATIEAHEITDSAGSSVSVPASTTSSIWLQLIKNASGQVTGAQYTVSATQPSDSILLCNFTSGTSSVSSVTDARTIGAVFFTYDANGNQVTRMTMPGGVTQGNTIISLSEGLTTKNNTLDDLTGNVKINGGSLSIANTIGGDPGFQIWNYNTALGNSLSNSNIGGLQFQINGTKQFAFGDTKVSTSSTGAITDLFSLWYSYITSAQVFKLDYVTNAVTTKVNTLDDGSGNIFSHGVRVSATAGQALTLSYNYTTAGTSQLNSPGFNFIGTGYYNTSGGLATMLWQFYNAIGGGSSTAQSFSTFTINPPNNTSANYFNILNVAPTSAGTYNSSAFILSGFGYDTASHEVDWLQQVQVTSQAGASTYHIQHRIGTNAYTDALTITDAGNVTISGNASISGSATISGGATISGVLTNTVGGDLSGTALNAITVAKLQGQTLTLGTPSANQVISWNGSAWVNTAPPAAGVSSLNTLTGALTLQSPNGTISVSTSTPDINIDFNLAHSNAWTALQTFPDIEIITGTGQALALGVSYTTAGTSQLSSPSLYFAGTGYYNTSGGLATMSWQFYNAITGGNNTTQSVSTFNIIPPSNNAGNYFEIFNTPFILANTVGGDAGFQIWNFNAALGNSLTGFTLGGNQFQINGSAQFIAPVTKVWTNSTGGITDLQNWFYSYITTSKVLVLDYVTNAVYTKNSTLDDGSGNATILGVLTGNSNIYIASHGLTFGLENESGETPPHFSLVNAGIARIMQFQIQSPYNVALGGGLIVGTTNTEQISTGGEVLATNLFAVGTSSGTDSLTGGGRLHSGQTGGHQVFIGTSSGGGQTSYTWICPPNVNSINVTLYGAGGGGGGGGAGNVYVNSGKVYQLGGGGGGGGGSGASTVNFPVAVTPGTSYTIYVGNGGTGGSGGSTQGTNGNAGGNGGASQAFNLTAGGGIGGGGGFAGTTGGGSGGTGSGSNGTSILFVLNSSVFTGANGVGGTISQATATGGNGGGGGRDPITGFFASGGAGGSGANGSNGQSGFNYSMGGGGGGGGGGQSYSGGAGGNGAPGAVIIDW